MPITNAKLRKQVMRKTNSILFLFLIGTIILPLRYFDFCVAHPFGHHHHDTGKPGICEQKKQYKGKESVIWPAMHCHKIKAVIDDFQLTYKYQLHSIVKLITIEKELFQFIKIPVSEEAFILPPDPKCNSGPINQVHRLRGPPIV